MDVALVLDQVENRAFDPSQASVHDRLSVDANLGSLIGTAKCPKRSVRQWPCRPSSVTLRLTGACPMPKTPLAWTADAFNNAFSAQVANITYHVTSRDYGYPAYVEVRGPRG